MLYDAIKRVKVTSHALQWPPELGLAVPEGGGKGRTQPSLLGSFGTAPASPTLAAPKRKRRRVAERVGLNSLLSEFHAVSGGLKLRVFSTICLKSRCNSSLVVSRNRRVLSGQAVGTNPEGSSNPVLSLNRLSARYVATVTEPGRHADGGGLYLSISENGGRRWVFLTRWRGKKIELGLGSARVVSLAEARKKAKAMRDAIAEGRHPGEARKTPDAVPTFGEAADELIETLKPTWRNPKHGDQWVMTLGHYCKPIRDISVADISTEDVLRVLKPIWLKKPETATRLRGRIERVIDAQRAKGNRKDENPARWRGHLNALLPARKKSERRHYAAMSYLQVPAFVQKLRAATLSVSNLALEFTILTAARSGETMGATEAEFDIGARLWTVPAERMKARREHQVPLSDRCVEILELVNKERRPGDKFIFPGRREGDQMSVMALAMALRRAGGEDFTVHGFRSSFRDWCGDCTNFPRDVAEAALAHTIRDATEAAYRRATALEKRRKLMDAWANYLSQQRGVVVPLAR